MTRSGTASENLEPAEPTDNITVTIAITLGEEISTMNRDCALDPVLAVVKHLRSGRHVILVYFEQITIRVQIKARNAGRVALSRVVVLAKDNAG